VLLQRTHMFDGASCAVCVTHTVSVQAEVLMLNRTILITGTNITARYKPNPPPPWPNPARQDGVWPTPWSEWANSSWPTEGLHVLTVGLCDGGSANGANCQSNGGFMQARYVRVEKAGQVSGTGQCPMGRRGTSLVKLWGLGCVQYAAVPGGIQDLRRHTHMQVYSNTWRPVH
jgi:hypothetical protein